MTSLPTDENRERLETGLAILNENTARYAARVADFIALRLELGDKVVDTIETEYRDNARRRASLWEFSRGVMNAT